MEERPHSTGLPSTDRPWMQFYRKEHVEGTWPKGSIYECLKASNEAYPDDVALLYYYKKITFGELFDRIDECARALIAAGVRRNDIVTIAMPSTPEAVYLLYAVNKIGAISNMIHPLPSVKETQYYLNEVKSRLFIMFTGTYAMMKNSLEGTSVEKAVVVSPTQSLSPVIRGLYALKDSSERIKETQTVVSWKTFIRKGKAVSLPSVQKADNDWAVISHTGGTTGTPKGVVCTNDSIMALSYSLAVDTSFERQGCMMTVLPPFVNASLVNTTIAALSYGYKNLLIPKYDPAKFIDYVSRYKVGYTMLIPAYFEVLLQQPSRPDSLSTLRMLASGGERLDAEVERAANEKIKECGATIKVTKGIGLTEMTSSATLSIQGSRCNVEGSVGIPHVNVNCKIADVEAGKELTYGEEGEVCFAGPTMMAGYYHDQEATDAMIKTDENGTRWLHTGDLGYLTEDGVLFVSGRMKRLLMQRDDHGVVSKVFPDRIESVVSRHPSVAACSVIGVHDDRRINVTKAFVECKKGTDASRARDEVMEYCREQLPGYMVPADVVVLPSLPRTSRGKVDYRALEAL
ncbi:MAG: acyl--CoA ligase [Prevotella sp.]|nr:acyl--CoA ligase [Prevotella sp.]